MAQLNVMDFSPSSNAMTQDKSEGLTRKMLSTSRERSVEIVTQKKNNCLITWVNEDMIGNVVDTNRSP